MIDVDVLCEVYLTLKQYVPVKDRQEAADNLLGSLVDMLSDEELSEFSKTDSTLVRSHKEYAGDIDDEYDDSDE